MKLKDRYILGVGHLDYWTDDKVGLYEDLFLFKRKILNKKIPKGLIEVKVRLVVERIKSRKS